MLDMKKMRRDNVDPWREEKRKVWGTGLKRKERCLARRFIYLTSPAVSMPPKKKSATTTKKKGTGNKNTKYKIQKQRRKEEESSRGEVIVFFR